MPRFIGFPWYMFELQTSKLGGSPLDFLDQTSMHDLSSTAAISFSITVNVSLSTHMSWKPISSAIVTAYKHALASAIVGSKIFFHGVLKLARI
ncbi:hypothetical protein ES332_D07G158700v1 [Gossypium tomentosum]|uniref:Uncharacterized protein n=1 Tax=Gossypium tomentosum TaxID=34277 RepID=A0A5D2K797_GOSTO|nr:hypothetical protein ES332_D07G158700v1 [Gossypium tomentosum]